MAYSVSHKFNVPMTEKLKSIPGYFGIRLADEPKYHIIDMEDDKEIRQYDRMTLASVTVTGSYEEAMMEGYHRLSQYLFGDNAKSLEMSMTTPIYEEKNQSSWTISFILPQNVTTTTAPTPLDHSIVISERPAHTAAVIWYTGGNELERVLDKTQELQNWIQTLRGYGTASDVKIAQYDSPSTIGFFRRNELQVEVAEVH